ncbi:receptor-type tyrosine-protein phosphatase epsilon-like isoform X2 [Denticeps clupeoides]|uniref:Tyrosine-protein phosphatase non-receptor type 20 n=1 Tax=Denticeps clupeoides TaxID=299321 RepID=A0AAY4DJJ7_9TELE|nr:receptor-type tyrosine-protein phosphatase epsilon-like isoform X2 [Denticeps clupeoides]
MLLLLTTTDVSNSSIHTNHSTESPTLQNGHLPSTVLILTLFILTLLFLCAYLLRFQVQQKHLVSTLQHKAPQGLLEDQDQTVVLLPRSLSPSQRFLPIPCSSLEEEYRRRAADESKLFREEYNSLPCVLSCCGAFEASREENRDKNRYPNILPNDHSRVRLSPVDGIPCSDYINASYIHGYKESNKFIAAQGPIPETVCDFWRMVWEQRSATIVMLTNLRERNEEKCCQYWPNQGSCRYGRVCVTLQQASVLVDYTIRKLSLQSGGDGCRETRMVTQMHFTGWPDFGVPFSPISTLRFLKRVRNSNPPRSGPITVHCSAGVGRTGTFIVIDAMLDMMQEEQRVDVFGFVSRIRQQRPLLVQTEMQYEFIYKAVLEHHLYGDTELDILSLKSRQLRLCNMHSAHHTLPHKHTVHSMNTHLRIEEEFRKLTEVRIMKENMRTGNLSANLRKNRVLQIIPYDFNRVILSIKRGQEFTDYINASFIDGYRQRDYFIATQAPLSHTVEDFWRMVWERKSHSIIMLTELQERGQEKCVQYWADEGSVCYGEFSVELTGEVECDSFSLRDLLLTHSAESRLVRHFQFHWPEMGPPLDGRGMIDMISAVQRHQEQIGHTSAIVHCSAGAGRTGVFIAVCILVERLQAEGRLDIFQTTKSLRLQRPHMVQTLEQYEFCYKVLQDFVDMFTD